MRVADEEVLQNVSGLVGVDDCYFRGGVCGGADPHQAGEFVLMPEFLFLLLNTHLTSYTDLQASKSICTSFYNQLLQALMHLFTLADTESCVNT